MAARTKITVALTPSEAAGLERMRSRLGMNTPERTLARCLHLAENAMRREAPIVDILRRRDRPSVRVA